jgi:hypothetical protein
MAACRIGYARNYIDSAGGPLDGLIPPPGSIALARGPNGRVGSRRGGKLGHRFGLTGGGGDGALPPAPTIPVPTVTLPTVPLPTAPLQAVPVHTEPLPTAPVPMVLTVPLPSVPTRQTATGRRTSPARAPVSTPSSSSSEPFTTSAR